MSAESKITGKCAGHSESDMDKTSREIPGIKEYRKGAMDRFSPEDWKECDICACSGRVDDIRCEECSGSGWINIKSK